LGNGWERLPRNHRLLTTDGSRETTGVVDGPDAFVLDERSGSREGKAAGGTIPVAVGRRTHGDNIGGSGRALAGQPDNYTFPVVAMSKTCTRLVFGHVPEPDQLDFMDIWKFHLPGVHNAKVGADLRAADVDLSSATGAVST
jgi:hypothetical protein